jgi:Uma2 family endonuclease
MSETPRSIANRPPRRYLRPPKPVRYPESDPLGETGFHLELRTALYLTLKQHIGPRGAVGSDQFIYYDPTNPRKCLSPDVMVHLGSPPEPFPIWKIWERGAPHLGVEFTSPSDTPPKPYRRKLERYHEAGIAEVVWFDRLHAEMPLRIWDRVEGDLVERDLSSPESRLCDTLGLYWCVVPDPILARNLRLAHDVEGSRLLPTPNEEHEKLAGALARVAELEAELARRK